MIYLILFIIFVLVSIFSIGIGFLINYHFKKMGIENDKNAPKIIDIYKKGFLIIFILGAISLLALIIIK